MRFVPRRSRHWNLPHPIWHVPVRSLQAGRVRQLRALHRPFLQHAGRYWEDATLSVVQVKGVGYQVQMTGQEARSFGFHGLELEFTAWLDALQRPGEGLAALSPEEGLADLLVVEAMCSGSS